jgi:chitinase
MALKSKAFPFLGIPLALAALAGCGRVGDIHVNRAPLAGVVGAAVRQAQLGSAVLLDASASVDPDGDALSYLWRLETPAGSHARLGDTSSAVVSFTPDVAGDYEVQLLVSDSEMTSVRTLVKVHALPENTAPTAVAGRPRWGTVGVPTELDGRGSSDAEGDTLTYRWTLTSPEGSHAFLSGSAMPDAMFVPDRAGVYVVTLVVSDGLMESPSDAIAVVVPENGEQPLQASADPAR